MEESISKMQENTKLSEQTSELLQNFKENDFAYTDTEEVQVKNVVSQTEQIIASYEERKKIR